MVYTMGLIDIIAISLKLFGLTAAMIVLLSYFIFKIKDRRRIKPYMRPTNIEPIPLEVKQEIKVEENEEKVDTPNKRYKVLNDYEPRFQVNPFPKVKPLKITKFNVINYQENNQISENKFNIYNYYSSKKFEPMHKIKT